MSMSMSGQCELGSLTLPLKQWSALQTMICGGPTALQTQQIPC